MGDTSLENIILIFCVPRRGRDARWFYLSETIAQNIVVGEEQVDVGSTHCRDGGQYP